MFDGDYMSIKHCMQSYTLEMCENATVQLYQNRGLFDDQIL